MKNGTQSKQGILGIINIGKELGKMKEIEYYIESNKKLMEQAEKEYRETENEYERLRLHEKIEIYRHYILGLQDAVKYIEKEKENK